MLEPELILKFQQNFKMVQINCANGINENNVVEILKYLGAAFYSLEQAHVNRMHELDKSRPILFDLEPEG